MKHKNIFVFILVQVLFFGSVLFFSNEALAYSSAKEVMSAVIASVFDENTPTPDFFKPFEKEFKESNTKTKNYSKLQEEVFTYVARLPERSVASKAQSLAVVAEVNKMIKALNTAKTENDKANKVFETKTKNLSFGDPAIDLEFKKLDNAFNSSKVKDLNNAQLKNSLEVLYATKNFYTYLSKTKFQYVFINGYLQAESPADLYEYYMYISKIRSLFQEKVKRDITKAEIYTNGEFKAVIDQKYIDLLNEKIKTNQQYVAIWSTVSSTEVTNPTSNTVYTKSELDTRRLNASGLQGIYEEIELISDDYNNMGAYDKERFSSKENLKKAIDLSTKVVSLYKKSDLADYLVRVQYNKDFPVVKSIFDEFVLTSDEDFRYNFVSVQNNALQNEDIELDIKLYKLALANFGKFTSDFETKDLPYRLIFKNKAANISYKKMLDQYRGRFAELFAYQKEQDAKKTETKPI